MSDDPRLYRQASIATHNVGRRDYDQEAHEALVRIEAHERTCTERQTGIYKRFDGVDGRFDRIEGLFVAILVSMVGGFGTIIYQLVTKT